MKQLLIDVDQLKVLAASSTSDDPWTRRRPAANAEPRDVRGGVAPPADEPSPGETSLGGPRARRFPLLMPGPLGCIAFKDKSMFDKLIMLAASYKYNGTKGGMAWKSRVERYFVTQAPCLRELLEWAEAEDNEAISEAKFMQAVSNRLTEGQAMNLNAQIWGFLSGCLEGSAEVMFKRAAWLNGIDAWCRVVRQLDHGRAIRLEML